MSLPSLTNRELAAHIQATGNKVSVAMDVVFGQFDSMLIPFNECCARLGADNEHVKAYRAAADTHAEALELGAIDARMTEDGWQSLTPGMRREIVRSHMKRAAL